MTGSCAESCAAQYRVRVRLGEVPFVATIRIRGRNLRRLLFFCSSVRPIRRAICSARSRSVNSLRTGFSRSAKAQPRPRCRRRPRPAPLATPSPTAVQAAANITLRGARATRDVRDASEIPGSRAAVLEVRIHPPPAGSLQTLGSCVHPPTSRDPFGYWSCERNR